MWQNIQLNTELLDCLRTPIFLTIVGLISWHNTALIQEWQLLTSTEERLEYLLDAYWENAIKSRVVTHKYKNPPNIRQTRKWLAFLAHNLQKEYQNEFVIDNIQTSFLPNIFARQMYALGVALLWGFIVGTIIGLIVFLNFFRFLGLVYSLSLGLIIAIFLTLFSCLWALLTIAQDRNTPVLEPIEILQYSWLNSAKSLSIGIVIGVISWLIIKIISQLLGLKYLPIEFFFIIAPALVLFLQRKPSQLAIKTRTKPNEGILLLLNNTIAFALTYAFWLGSSALLIRHKIFSFILFLVFNQSEITSPFTSSIADTAIIVFSGMLVGLLFAISQPGIACIQHFIIRINLYYSGCIPWDYVRFLDYCTERKFLQRVGGRYRFIHRLLQEYFAAMPFGKG